MKKEKFTIENIGKISNNLLRIRTKFILQKRRLLKLNMSKRDIESIEEFVVYDEAMKEMEMEFNMLKFIWFNMKK